MHPSLDGIWFTGNIICSVVRLQSVITCIFHGIIVLVSLKLQEKQQFTNIFSVRELKHYFILARICNRNNFIPALLDCAEKINES